MKLFVNVVISGVDGAVVIVVVTVVIVVVDDVVVVVYGVVIVVGIMSVSYTHLTLPTNREV